jgi:transposase
MTLGKRHPTNINKAVAVGIFQATKSLKETSYRTGYSRSSIKQWLKKLEENGSLDRRLGSGRPRKTTCREDRRIAICTKKDRSATGESIKQDLQLYNVCERTIRRRIASETGFHSYWKTGKPYISKKQIEEITMGSRTSRVDNPSMEADFMV